MSMMKTNTARHAARRGAFTLVELLVVIGIIALLISILLPALNAARRQAATVKCLTQMRELGNAFRMYSIDSKGYQAPGLIVPSGTTYTVDNATYPISGYGAHWFVFINKYISKNVVGVGNTTVEEGKDARFRSVLWGCPNWDGYPNATYGFNRLHPGYGMNIYNGFTESYPTPFGSVNFPNKPEDQAVNYAWTPATASVGFVKATKFTHPAERALLADARLWLLESTQVPASGKLADQYSDINVGNSIAGESTASFWRHSRLPTSTGSRTAAGTTGPIFPISNASKISYNILYCDGHVATSTDATDAFRRTRMRFPG